jgi:hypothetical protein
MMRLEISDGKILRSERQEGVEIFLVSAVRHVGLSFINEALQEPIENLKDRSRRNLPDRLLFNQLSKDTIRSPARRLQADGRRRSRRRSTPSDPRDTRVSGGEPFFFS